jgi:hypothetical protein
MYINDTSASQSLIVDPAVRISITGQSFVSLTYADYVLKFSGAGCTGVNSTVTPDTITQTSAYVNVLEATIDTTGCSSDVSVNISYDGFDSFGTTVIAEIYSVIDTTTTKSLAPTSDQSITITGTGLPTDANDVSFYSLNFVNEEGQCTGLSNYSLGGLSAQTGGNTDISSDASSITISGVDLTGCSGEIKVSLSRVTSAGTTSTEYTGIGTIVKLTDTLTSKYLIENTIQAVTLTGEGFGDSITSNYVLEFACIDTYPCKDASPSSTTSTSPDSVNGLIMTWSGNLTECSAGQILCARVNYASQSSPQVWTDVASFANIITASSDNAVRDSTLQNFDLTGYGSPSKALIYAASCTPCIPCDATIDSMCACLYDVDLTTTETSSAFLINGVVMTSCTYLISVCVCASHKYTTLIFTHTHTHTHTTSTHSGTSVVYMSIPASSSDLVNRLSGVEIGYVVGISDTSTAYSVAIASSNATITIEGEGFADTDSNKYTITVTVDGSCTLNTLTVSHISTTSLKVSGLDMTLCTGVTSGIVNAVLKYSGISTDASGSGSWTLSGVNVASVMSFDTDTSLTQPIFDNTNVTITGIGFGSTLTLCSDCTKDFKCQVDGSYSITPTVSNWARISSTELNFQVNAGSTCNGILKLTFKYTNVTVATIFIGTFVTLDNGVSNAVCTTASGAQTKSVTGSGFLSNNVLDYTLKFYCSDGSNTMQELSSTISSRSNSATFSTAIDFDSCAYDATYKGIIYHNIEYNSKVLYESCSIASPNSCATYVVSSDIFREWRLNF